MWDLVVLTACDSAQKDAFEAQLQWRQEATNQDGRGSTPAATTATQFRVYADWPKGEKIGSGGATLVALEQLHNEFGDELYLKRVMIIHTGGYCQRQPNASVLGKVFTVLPTASPSAAPNWPYTILDLKLDLYVRLAASAPPGVFVAAADALEWFRLDDPDVGRWTFEDSGFTVLAHPSSLEIAQNHGVYILDGPPTAAESANCSAVKRDVLRVLQKPSLDLLHASGAVVTQTPVTTSDSVSTVPTTAALSNASPPNVTSSNATSTTATSQDQIPMSHSADVLPTTETPMAYTDSAFFFASDVTRRLLAFYAKHKPLRCELNAYADLLMPLGVDATPAYFAGGDLDGSAIARDSIVSAAPPDDAKRDNTNELAAPSEDDNSITENTTSSVNARVTSSSSDSTALNFCRARLYRLLRDFRLTALVLPHSLFYHVGTFKELLYAYCDSAAFHRHFALDGRTVVSSRLTDRSAISRRSFVEFCRFSGARVRVTDGCVLSNCMSAADFTIERAVFLQTVPLSGGLCVTVLMGTFDNAKSAGADIRVLGRPLKDLKKCFGLETRPDCSLWTLPLYPAAKTMQESFSLALEMIDYLVDGNKVDLCSCSCDGKLYSIAECLRNSDFKAMIEFRKKLAEQQS